MLMLMSSQVSNVVQLIIVLFIFIFVLALTYITTRWIAKIQSNQIHSKNIKVIETYKIAPNKYIQIIQTGKIYLVIAVGKDNVSLLTQLEEEQLNSLEDGTNQYKDSFSDILNKVKALKRNK